MHPAKEYLQRYNAIKERKKKTICLLKDVYSDVAGTSGIDYSRDVVKTSPTNDSMIRMLEDIEKRAKTLETDIIRCRESMYTIEDQVRGMEKELHITILWDVYIEGMKLFDVADCSGLSYQYIRDEHSNALQKFFEKYLRNPTKSYNEM